MVAVSQGGWGVASRWWWWDKASSAPVSDRIVHLRDMEARVFAASERFRHTYPKHI